MPDISLCSSENCGKRARCYRATAKPSEFNQSYTDFWLTVPLDCGDPDADCKYYIPAKSGMSRRLDIQRGIE